jgi:GDP-L-fucose synthase
MHEGKVRGATEVEIWGSGTPRREFLYSNDAADACVFLMNLPEEQLGRILTQNEIPPLVNIGYGEDLTIREVAHLIAEVVGFKGRQVFDFSKPDGTPQKLLDISRLMALGWTPQTSLREGLEKTYQDFCESVSRASQPSLASTE